MGFNAELYGEDAPSVLPPSTLKVFDSIAMRDFDVTFPQCGKALRALVQAGLCKQTRGDKLPVTLTVSGRKLATDRGVPIFGTPSA